MGRGKGKKGKDKKDTEGWTGKQSFGNHGGKKGWRAESSEGKRRMDTDPGHWHAVSLMDVVTVYLE